MEVPQRITGNHRKSREGFQTKIMDKLLGIPPTKRLLRPPVHNLGTDGRPSPTQPHMNKSSSSSQLYTCRQQLLSVLLLCTREGTAKGEMRPHAAAKGRTRWCRHSVQALVGVLSLAHGRWHSSTLV